MEKKTNSQINKEPICITQYFGILEIILDVARSSMESFIFNKRIQSRMHTLPHRISVTFILEVCMNRSEIYSVKSKCAI